MEEIHEKIKNLKTELLELEACDSFSQAREKLGAFAGSVFDFVEDVSSREIDEKSKNVINKVFHMFFDISGLSHLELNFTKSLDYCVDVVMVSGEVEKVLDLNVKTARRFKSLILDLVDDHLIVGTLRIKRGIEECRVYVGLKRLDSPPYTETLYLVPQREGAIFQLDDR